MKTEYLHNKMTVEMREVFDKNIDAFRKMRDIAKANRLEAELVDLSSTHTEDGTFINGQSEDAITSIGYVWHQIEQKITRYLEVNAEDKNEA